MAVKTSINTIRHAQTCYSAENRYAGTIDIPLSEAGVRQAQLAAARLSEMHFDIIVTSTLKRTVETAQILVGDQMPIVRSKLCNERDFGVFQGKTREEVNQIVPPVLWITVGHDTHSINQAGSEPFEKVWARALKFRNWLFHEYSGLSILVVSHGVFLQLFHGLLRGQNCIESLVSWPETLELSRFIFNDKQLVDENLIKLNHEKREISF